jgi:hypothetical protein
MIFKYFLFFSFYLNKDIFNCNQNHQLIENFQEEIPINTKYSSNYFKTFNTSNSNS